MPKLKTHKGVAKRCKLTASGKVKRTKSSKRHILTKKTRKRKRSLRASGMVAKSFEKKIKELIHAG